MHLARLVWSRCCNRRACLAMHPSAPEREARAALLACSSHPALSRLRPPPMWHLVSVPPYDLHRAFGHPDSEILADVLSMRGRGDWLDETARATAAFYASALGATRRSPPLKLQLVVALALATLRESGLEWEPHPRALPPSLPAEIPAQLLSAGLAELLVLADARPWVLASRHSAGPAWQSP